MQEFKGYIRLLRSRFKARNVKRGEKRSVKSLKTAAKETTTSRGVAWPFWQVRTRIHIRNKITLWLSFNSYIFWQITVLFTIERDIKKSFQTV